MIVTWRRLIIFSLLALGCAGPPRTGGDLQVRAMALNDAGYQYYRQSRWTLAQNKFAQALQINRLIDRRVGIAANLNNLGVIALEMGDVEPAVAYFQEALGINRELEDASGICETLNNLGLAYQAQGRAAAAQAAYQEALEYARGLPPGSLRTLSLTHLGDVARLRRDFPLALAYYHQAQAIDEQRNDPRGRAMRWERLGRTFLDLQDYGRARGYLNDALREFRRLEDTGGIVDTLKDLTQLALAQGDRQEAQLHGQLLLEIYQARGQEKEAEKLQGLLRSAAHAP